MNIKFGADKVRINGPKVDGSYSLTFETGEYEKDKILDIMKLDPPYWVQVNDEETD